jgi:hypothetical protein
VLRVADVDLLRAGAILLDLYVPQDLTREAEVTDQLHTRFDPSVARNELGRFAVIAIEVHSAAPFRDTVSRISGGDDRVKDRTRYELRGSYQLIDAGSAR